MSKNNLIPKRVLRSDGVMTTVMVKRDGTSDYRRVPAVRSADAQAKFDAVAVEESNRSYITLTKPPVVGDIVRATAHTKAQFGIDAEISVEGTVSYVEDELIKVEGWFIPLNQKTTIELAVEYVEITGAPEIGDQVRVRIDTEDDYLSYSGKVTDVTKDNRFFKLNGTVYSVANSTLIERAQ